MSSAVLTTETVAERISRALRRHFGHLRYADQHIADLSQSDPRAVRNWRSGTNPPGVAALLNLMAESEAMEAEIVAMVRAKREGRLDAR